MQTTRENHKEKNAKEQPTFPTTSNFWSCNVCLDCSVMVIAMGKVNECAGSYAIIWNKVADRLVLEDRASQSLQSKCEDRKSSPQLSSKRETFKDARTNMHSNYSTTKKKAGSKRLLLFFYLAIFIFDGGPIHFDLEKQRPQTLKSESACSGLRKTLFGVYSFRLFL